MLRRITFYKYHFVEFYEVRIQYSRNSFRIFCFFDEGPQVVLLHGVQKKSIIMKKV